MSLPWAGLLASVRWLVPAGVVPGKRPIGEQSGEVCKREIEKVGKRERERESAREKVCVCVCVREREGEASAVLSCAGRQAEKARESE